MSPIKDPGLYKPDSITAILESPDICIPFHILVFYFKNAKSGITSDLENDLINDLLVKSFISLSIDPKFVCYLVNESDFIEALMTKITRSMEYLPETLDPVDIMGNFNLAR